jgi:uncharacterized repeat protein (TIGR01451 family)/fimbrial isopeptide formation D2 family protein
MPILRVVRRSSAAVIFLLALAPVAAQAQPTPTATLTAPASPLIGETLTLPVTFDNTGSATGYGPFVDLVLPAPGADGAGAATDDGITFVSATYLGAPVTSVVLTFDGAGNATHPYARTSAGAPVVVTGIPGYQLVVLQLPFGSFTPSQPAATVQVTAALSNLADAGTALNLRARGGFQYGTDPLDNPPSDPSTLGAFTANQPVTPAVWRMTKTYIGPEDETASGPNFPRQYRIDVDIATGQTVTALDLTDVLPGNLQFLAVVSTLVNGGAAATTAVATPSTATPGGTLTRRFASVTGTAGTQDASLVFSYFVPRAALGGGAVIDPTSGDDAVAIDDARSQGNWTPIDGRDGPTFLVNDATAIDHTLAPKSTAIQKSVAIAVDTGGAGPTPGDTLEYTLQIQVSDFFALRNLVVTDVLSDGQRRLAGFAPTLAITEHSGGASVAAAMAPANATFVVSGTTGETTGTFQVGAEQLLRGLDDRLIGGCVPAGGTGGPAPDCATFNGGATTLTIVYRATIEQNFSNTFPSGDASVDHGDRLVNAVSAEADLLSVADAVTPTGTDEADGSGAGVTILVGTLTKTIYAINGSTSFGTPRLGPGDTVTYRLRYTLPSSDLEPVTITDYLPLPVLFATEVSGPLTATVSAAAPPAGTAKFGPADTFFALSGLIPTIATDAAGNFVRFIYPAFDDPGNTPTTIDLLFTVTASNQPFADGLFLTNQARVQEGTTNAGESIVDAIVQIQLNEPNVRIVKGVVTSSNPAADVYTPAAVGPVGFSAPGTAGFRGSGAITSGGLAATPINSNVSGLDAGDVVTFAVVVENLGSGPEGAFDVTFADTIPAGFVVPASLAALNLSVTTGSGVALPFTDLGGGPFAGGGGLFGAGLRLDDPSASQGALTTYGPGTGTNLAIVTYDLVVAPTVIANFTYINTATLANYAGTEGGPDFTAVDPTDVATAFMAPPSMTKTITATNQAHTTGTNVAIGERVSYRLTIRVPEGTTPSAVLTDTLDAGLAFQSLDAISASPALAAANGSFAAVLAAATIGPVGGGASNAGRLLTLNFGTLTNSDADNASDETIVVDYTAVVLNSTGNDRGGLRNNAAALAFSSGAASAAAPNVTLQEPTLQVAKTAVPTGGDAGDPVTFTVTLSHTAASNTTAFDVALTDVLPAGLTFTGAAFQSGLAPTTFSTGGGFSAGWATFPVGSTATFQVSATIDSGLGSGAVLVNTATTTYTSLPGDVTTAQTANNTLSTERTGNTANPGGAVNDYTAAGSASVTVSSAAVTKIVVGTNQAHTTGTNVAVGEILTYTVTVTVPEAVSSAVTLVDTLDPGLAFVGVDSLVVSNPVAVTTSVAGGFTFIRDNPAVTNPGGTVDTAGSRVSFTFGTVTNTDTNSAVAETITLTYRAVVLNTAFNLRGQTRNNSAAWTVSGVPVTASAPDVTLVEPALLVTKTAAPVTGDANDTVTFTIVVAHTGASNTDAFDLVLTDPIPAGFTVSGGPSVSSGLPATSLTLSAGTITGSWTAFPLGATSTITFTATLGQSIVPGTVTTNTATATWTSLPGAVGAPQSSFNPLSVERTGNPGDAGGAANTYTAADPATVTLNSNSLAGRVYVDGNDDGLFTVGEAPIAGVTIMLTGTDHLGNAVALTTTTAAGGTYQFTGLRPGTYTVRETQPIAYADGLDRAGSLGGTLGNDVVSAIAIPLGGPTAAIDYDFGERPTADLEVVKTDLPDPVTPGSALTYTLVVRNNGPSVAANVVLRDPLPTGTAFTSIAAPGFSCSTPAAGTTGDVVCTTATLAVGASTTVTLTVQVAATLLDGAVITNAAAVRSDTVDLVPGNNTDREPTTVAAPTSVDLAIAKTDAADPVLVGANITYTLTVRNDGPAAATGVTVTDTLPAGLTLVSATPSQGAPCTGTTTVSCVLGGLAAGAQATVAVVATASTTGVVVNTATVAGAEPDPAPDNNTATEPTTIANPGDADLRVAKVDSPDPALADGLVAYTITVENRGPAAASSVTLSDPLPAATTFESLSAPGGWICTTPTVGATGAISCVLPTLATGATASFDLRVRVAAGTPAGTSLVNTATVASTTPDPDAANNTDTEPTLVVAPGSADVAIVKTDAPDPQAAGAAVSYTFTVTNFGPAAATAVTVTDTLPAGTAVIATSTGCSVASGVLSCTLGTLAPGASTAVGVTLSTPPVAGVLTNTASVSAAEPDPVPGNNSEPEVTTLVPRADVRVAKTGPATATAGSTVVYTITVVNDGPSVADAVTVADATPAGLTFVSNAGACTTAYPCVLGQLLPGASRVITTTFAVPAGYTAPDPIVNTATVSTTTPGDALANNSATASTPLAFAGDVAVAKTASTMTPGVGTSFDYVITVTNLGPSNVTGVVITESLPVGVTYLSHLVSAGAYAPGPALWTIPALAAGGGSATLTLTVRADAAGPLANTATRTATDQPDPNPANDQATVTPVATANADVAVVKSGPASVLVGGTAVYTLTVTNNGPAVATGVVVADPTPANLTFVSTSGACTTAFPCALGTMAVGEVRTIAATYTAGNAADGTVVTNVATVTATSPDPVAGNNQASVPTVIVQLTDVGVTKIVAPATVVVGGAVTYTVTATNYGPNPASGVVVTDRLPAGVAYTSSTPSQGSYDSVTGAWSIGALAVGQSVTLSIGATVQVPGPITNLAVRTGQNEPDSNQANDSAVAVVNSPPYADVGVNKVVAPPTPAVGAAVTFTVRVTNYGPATAPSVVVDDPVPSGLSITGAAPSVGTYVAGTGRWTVGPLAVGASATLTLIGTTAAAGTVINRAVISGTGIFDPNPLNDRDAIGVVVGPPPAVAPASLRLAKVALRPFLPIDDFAEFVVSVTNDGPGTATGVVVTETLPAGLVHVEARTSQGGYAPGTGQWTIGSLAATQTVTLQIVARVTTPGRAVNTATITGVTEPDPDPSDNTATAEILTPAPGAVDLEITQELPSVAPPNGLLTIRLVTRNLGPSAALNPYVTGMIPPGTLFVSSNPGAGGSCTVPGNPPPPDPTTGYPVTGVAVPPLTCTWPGLMQPGESRVVEFTVRVAPGIATGQILWSCFFTGTQTDEPYQPNNVIDGYLFVHDGIASVGDLAITAIAQNADGALGTTVPAAIGTPIRLRFSSTNAGPAPARGQYALILDAAGAIEVVSATTAQGWVAPTSASSGVWDTGQILPGQTVTLDLTVRLRTAAQLTLFAQRVAGQPGDPNASNERATLVLDGYGPATGGRAIAVGNIDGSGGAEIVTGAGQGETPQLRLFTGGGVDTGLRYFAFERSFRGGLRLASCDVDNDGVAEIIAAPGPGRASTIRVLRPSGGVVTEVVSFDAFETSFQGGAYVSCADLDADGSAEVVVGSGPGRPGEVRVFAVGAGTVVPRATFAAYEPSFLGGVRVAAGAYAGRPGLPAFAIATTPGPGRAPELRLWTNGGAPVAQAIVSAATSGLHPALGDANGDGGLDLALAPEEGRPELLRIFAIDSGGVLADVPAGAAGFTAGVRVAMGRLQGGPGASELVVADGPGAAPRVRVVTWLPSGPVLRLEFAPLETP